MLFSTFIKGINGVVTTSLVLIFPSEPFVIEYVIYPKTFYSECQATGFISLSNTLAVINAINSIEGKPYKA
jgi:hypothetical protein